MTQEQSPSAPADSEARKPERKIGPFAGGISVAIWCNSAETDDGPRQFRSISISPRRYQEQGTGKWKNAKSFQPSDIPILMFALQQAQEFIIQNPLRRPAADDQNGEDPMPF